jgi:hypothetical protein
MHKELSSKSFTEALLRLAADRVRITPATGDVERKGEANSSQSTHQQVKTKILERMEEWTEMFSRDTDLGIMEQAYMRLKTQSMFSCQGYRIVNTNLTQTLIYILHRNHRRRSSPTRIDGEKKTNCKWPLHSP